MSKCRSIGSGFLRHTVRGCTGSVAATVASLYEEQCGCSNTTRRRRVVDVPAITAYSVLQVHSRLAHTRLVCRRYDVSTAGTGDITFGICGGSVRESRLHYLCTSSDEGSAHAAIYSEGRCDLQCLPCAFLVRPCLEVNPHDKA